MLENPTDQIELFSYEVYLAAKKLRESYGCSLSEAIEIARIGAYNIRTEVIKHIADDKELEVVVSDG